MFNATVRETVTAVALARDLEPAALLAIALVESAGVPFWTVNGRQVPAARAEGHYFFDRLTGQQQTRAVNAGLAHPNAGVVKNPHKWADRYAMIERMKAIDEDAALESCSWGIGQVMGTHWKALGYRSVQHMVEVAYSGIEGQLDLMIRFIDINGLRPLVEKRKWAAFARRYNGRNYKKNRYDTKLAAAYKRFADPSIFQPDPFVLQVQKDLTALGFDPGPTDGSDGPKTKSAIKAFQAANNLEADGIAGPMTLEEIEDDLAALKNKTSDKMTKTGTGGAAASGMGAAAAEKATDALQNASDSLQPLSQISDVIMWIFIALAIAGVVVALWGIFRPREEVR